MTTPKNESISYLRPSLRNIIIGLSIGVVVFLICWGVEHFLLESDTYKSQWLLYITLLLWTVLVIYILHQNSLINHLASKLDILEKNTKKFPTDIANDIETIKNDIKTINSERNKRKELKEILKKYNQDSVSRNGLLKHKTSGKYHCTKCIYSDLKEPRVQEEGKNYWKCPVCSKEYSEHEQIDQKELEKQSGLETHEGNISDTFYDNV